MARQDLIWRECGDAVDLCDDFFLRVVEKAVKSELHGVEMFHESPVRPSCVRALLLAVATRPRWRSGARVSSWTTKERRPYEDEEVVIFLAREPLCHAAWEIASTHFCG